MSDLPSRRLALVIITLMAVVTVALLLTLPVAR